MNNELFEKLFENASKLVALSHVLSIYQQKENSYYVSGVIVHASGLLSHTHLTIYRISTSNIHTVLYYTLYFIEKVFFFTRLKMCANIFHLRYRNKSSSFKLSNSPTVNVYPKEYLKFLYNIYLLFENHSTESTTLPPTPSFTLHSECGAMHQCYIMLIFSIANCLLS